MGLPAALPAASMSFSSAAQLLKAGVLCSSQDLAHGIDQLALSISSACLVAMKPEAWHLHATGL
jgi:hypothetical protein